MKKISLAILLALFFAAPCTAQWKKVKASLKESRNDTAGIFIQLNNRNIIKCKEIDTKHMSGAIGLTSIIADGQKYEPDSIHAFQDEKGYYVRVGLQGTGAAAVLGTDFAGRVKTGRINIYLSYGLMARAANDMTSPYHYYIEKGQAGLVGLGFNSVKVFVKDYQPALDELNEVANKLNTKKLIAVVDMYNDR